MTAKRVNGLTDLDGAAVCDWRDEYGLWWVYRLSAAPAPVETHGSRARGRPR
jgi:hypothetical protein